MTRDPVLFLDIDGVLIAYPEGEPTTRVFTPRCVEAFRMIISAIPTLRVVFSSTWRHPEHVNRLHEQWIAQRLPVSLAIDGTPDLRTDAGVPRLHRRGCEIRRWLDEHPECEQWAVIDDDWLAIERVLDVTRCVFTNPQRGLEIHEAERAIDHPPQLVTPAGAVVTLPQAGLQRWVRARTHRPLTDALSSSVCTAYEIGKRGGSFPERVKAAATRELLEIGQTKIVRPTHSAPVIMPDGTLEMMRWGFRRAMAAKTPGKKTWRTIVNSREDKLAGRTWRDAFENRRCLISAATFFEWISRDGVNVPLRFKRPDDGWFWIAGIWEEDQEGSRRFSMITTEPSQMVAPVHDRMPAVLSDDRIEPFLDGELEDFGPSPVPLEFTEAENFLKAKSKSKKPPGAQGELF